MSYGSPPPPPPPPPPILATILCFWPVGIAAIVFSTQVNGKWARGDVVGAQTSSRRAKNFSIATAVIGLVLGIGVVALRLGS